VSLVDARALCVWMESVWPGSRPRRWFGRSVWVFLARGRFAAKTPARERWIVLDSLVRIETYQWVTRHEARKIFSRRSIVALEASEREPADEAVRKGRIAHGASLPIFLIFCNKLLESFSELRVLAGG
jgi:hypothetical protein